MGEMEPRYASIQEARRAFTKPLSEGESTIVRRMMEPYLAGSDVPSADSVVNGVMLEAKTAKMIQQGVAAREGTQ